MGNSNHGGDSTDVNFFDAKRNDVPAYSGAHAEVYRDCPTGSAGAGNQRHDKMVTINETDASGRTNTIYAEAGSTININVGGYERVGNGGRNGYIANYDQEQQRNMESRQAQYYQPQPGQRMGYDDYQGGGYRTVHGADYRQPYPQYEQHRPNPVGQFFGSLLGGLANGVGFGLGERAFGGHHIYRPYAPVNYGYDNYSAQSFNPGYNPGYGAQAWNNPNNYSYQNTDYGYQNQNYAYNNYNQYNQYNQYNSGPGNYGYERPYYGGRSGYYGHGRGNTGLAIAGGALLGVGLASLANGGNSGYYS